MMRWPGLSSRALARASTAVVALLMAVVLVASASAQDGLATVKVNIAGFKGTEGVALIALFDSEASWRNVPKAVQVLRMKITGGTLNVEFKGVKPGTYAVQVVHDENKNNELDMRWLPYPKPKEGSAVSNDPETKSGPPKWEGAKFDVTPAGTTVKATMKYFD
jgi:uncharacterized protein (DUF2141 family)